MKIQIAANEAQASAGEVLEVEADTMKEAAAIFFSHSSLTTCWVSTNGGKNWWGHDRPHVKEFVAAGYCVSPNTPVGYSYGVLRMYPAGPNVPVLAGVDIILKGDEIRAERLTARGYRN